MAKLAPTFGKVAEKDPIPPSAPAKALETDGSWPESVPTVGTLPESAETSGWGRVAASGPDGGDATPASDDVAEGSVLANEPEIVPPEKLEVRGWGSVELIVPVVAFDTGFEPDRPVVSVVLVPAVRVLVNVVSAPPKTIEPADVVVSDFVHAVGVEVTWRPPDAPNVEVFAPVSTYTASIRPPDRLE